MKQCAVDGCDGPIKARGWCWKHYLRWHRHGDVEYEPPRHSVCVVDDCQKIPDSVGVGLCEMHRARVRRHGSPHTVLPRRRPVVGYAAAHDRVRRDKGKVSDHACVDCGRWAEQWSYDHQDPESLLSPEGFPYSLDVNSYEPRCVSCHVAFDKPTKRAAN